MERNAKIIDESVKRVLQALKKGYGRKHPKAQIDAYRYNPSAIRVRIIDPDFARMGRVEREDQVFPSLDALPDEIFTDLSLLLLITPREHKQSLGSLEFDNPTPWVPLNLEG
jgi:hypothetical protein